MAAERFESLYAYLGQRYPQFQKGVEEALAVDPNRFSEIAEMYLGWLVRARGEDGIAQSVDAFVQFTTDVNLAQARDVSFGQLSFASSLENWLLRTPLRFYTLVQLLLNLLLTPDDLVRSWSLQL